MLLLRRPWPASPAGRRRGSPPAAVPAAGGAAVRPGRERDRARERGRGTWGWVTAKEEEDEEGEKMVVVLGLCAVAVGHRPRGQRRSPVAAGHRGAPVRRRQGRRRLAAYRERGTGRGIEREKQRIIWREEREKRERRERK